MMCVVQKLADAPVLFWVGLVPSTSEAFEPVKTNGSEREVDVGMYVVGTFARRISARRLPVAGTTPKYVACTTVPWLSLKLFREISISSQIMLSKKISADLFFPDHQNLPWMGTLCPETRETQNCPSVRWDDRYRRIQQP